MAPTIKCKNEFSDEFYDNDTSNLFKRLFGGPHSKEETDALNHIKGKIGETDEQRNDALLGLERYRLYVIILMLILVVLVIVYFMFIVSQSSNNASVGGGRGGGRVRFSGGKK